MQFISRVVGGWNVRMTLSGKRLGKFFADAKHGGKKKALQASQKYRDSLVAIRKSRTKPKAARPLVVVRGKAKYVQIRIPMAKGTKTTEFSIKRHGPKKAKLLAVKAYNAAMKKLAK